jgi:hypothetical protein
MREARRISIARRFNGGKQRAVRVIKNYKLKIKNGGV